MVQRFVPVWAVPEACSLLTESTLVHPGCRPCTQPPREEETGLPAGQAAHPRPNEPQNSVGCKSRCLRRGSFPSPVDGRRHCLFTFSLTGAPSTGLCSLGFAATPSLCDKPTRERFHYLMFNYYLGNGLELPRALLRRACPRQTPSVGSWGPSPAVLAVAGRRAGGGQCSGLKSAAPCSWELALVSLETSVLHLKVCCLYLGLQFLCPATQETLRSLWGVN